MATKRKDPKDFKKLGRPTNYTPKLADEICDAIASSELGLAHLVDANEHWPARGTIFIWMRRHPEFRDKYTAAKEDQQDVCVEYMQEILNEPHKYIDKETGSTRIDVSMLRVKIDTMKWQASKLKPKKFADKIDMSIPENEILEDSLKRKQELDAKNKKDF